MSEPSRGIIAQVSFNHPPSSRGLEPKRVEHLQLGIAWRVTEISTAGSIPAAQSGHSGNRT